MVLLQAEEQISGEDQQQNFVFVSALLLSTGSFNDWSGHEIQNTHLVYNAFQAFH